LINVGERVLEKLLVNRIMHHVYSINLMNHNTFGFTQKKSGTNAALAVKGYLEESKKEGTMAVLVSLDVNGAFDAAS
jgi:GH18 family chitinase